MPKQPKTEGELPFSNEVPAWAEWGAARGLDLPLEEDARWAGSEHVIPYSSPLDGAIRRARLGEYQSPVVPGGKKPLLKWGTQYSTDEATLRMWYVQEWKRKDQDGIEIDLGSRCNFLTVCRPSGLMVFDVDGREGELSLAGFEFDAGGELPPTFTVNTPRVGGRHIIYKGVGPCFDKGQIGPHLDIKSAGHPDNPDGKGGYPRANRLRQVKPLCHQTVDHGLKSPGR